MQLIVTQPVQAPGSFPEVQPTSEGDLSAASDSEADQLSVTGSLDEEIHRDRSADRDVSRDDPDSEPTEEANYRETMRGVRSFMNWHNVPEFETVSSTADGLCRCTCPDLPDGMGCTLRRTVRAQQYAPGHQTLPNSTIPSAGLPEETFLLPHPPGPSVKIYSGVGREQHVNRQ